MQIGREELSQIVILLAFYPVALILIIRMSSAYLFNFFNNLHHRKEMPFWQYGVSYRGLVGILFQYLCVAPDHLAFGSSSHSRVLA